jgi:hypothetical protein
MTMMVHSGYVPEADDDQLAALRRLRAAFGFVELLEVINHEQAQDEAVQGPEGDDQPPPTNGG